MKNWTNKKLRNYLILFNILYIIFMVILPVIYVTIEYNSYESVQKYRLTSMTIILYIIIMFIFINCVNKIRRKIPDYNRKWQCFKYTLDLIPCLVVIFAILFFCEMMKVDFSKAYNCVKFSCYTILFGCIIDKMFLQFMNKEYDLRIEAKKQIDINERKKFWN